MLPYFNDATPTNATTILYGRAFRFAMFLPTGWKKISTAHGFLFRKGLFINRSLKKELASRSQTMGHGAASAGNDWGRPFEVYGARAERMFLNLPAGNDEKSEGGDRNDNRISVGSLKDRS
jgi:hypothetical protein